MSRIKKLIVAVLCVVLAVTASLLVFAACDKDETGYKVTLNYIKEQGSVTVSAPAEGKLYDANERVTVTVTPNADYQVAAFTVNGTAKELTDDTTYAFDITADTTIAVTFEEKPETGFSLTLTFDDQQGTVTASAPAEGELYDENESVTITVTPNTDYQVATFTVNGTAQNLTDGTTYTFQITTDTTIAVTFEQTGSQDECPWTDIIGTWEKEQDSVLYHVEITETDVIVKFNGVQQTVTNIHWVEDDLMISITIDGTEYFLGDFYGALGFVDSDWEFVVYLTRVQGGGDVGGDDDNLFSAEQIGTYAGSNAGSDKTITDITITIFENSIIINGEQITDIVNDDGEFTFESNGKTYYLYFGGGIVSLNTDDGSEAYSLHSVCPWLQYVGKFETDPAEDAEYESPHVILTITEDSITVQIADQSFTVQAADITFGCEDFGEGLVFNLTFEHDSTTYYAYFASEDFINLMNDADEDYIDAYLYRAGSHEVCEWAELIGTWTGKGSLSYGFGTPTPVDVTVEITETEITVTIGQGEDPQTAEQISVSENDGGYILTFTLGQQSYTFDAYQGEATFTSGDGTLSATLELQNAEPIEWSDAWYGEYQGEKNGTTYYIEITSDTVNVTIGDSGAQRAEILDFSDYDGFTIQLDGTTYTIKRVLNPEDPSDEIIQQIKLADEEFELQVTLTRQEETLGIPQGYIGNWTGVFEDISLNINLVVSDAGIQIDGKDATNIKVNSDSVTFSQGSFEYTLTLTSTGIHIKREAEYLETQETDLTKGGGGGDEEPTCEWEYYIGTYRGYDGTNFFTITIDEDGITITMSSSFGPRLATVKIVEYVSDVEGFILKINDETRLLQSSGGTDEYSTFLSCDSEDHEYSFYLSRSVDDFEWTEFSEIAGTWTGTETLDQGVMSYSLVIKADGTGSATVTTDEGDMPLEDVRFENNGYICMYFSLGYDSCLVLYYDGNNLYALAGMMGGPLTLTKTAGGDEETVTIPDKFIGEYSDSGYEVTITADSITITVKGTTETPNSTYTATNIKVDGNTITCTAIGDTCTITAIGDGDKAQQINLRIPSIGTRTLDRKAESGGDTDLTEESFYGTFEGSDSVGDYVLSISADGITFTITLKTEPDEPTTAKGENVSFVDGAIHFKISGAMEVIVTNASQGDTITKIHVECSYMNLSTDLTRTTAGDDDTDLTEESFYGTFEGTDGSSITITAEGVTSFNVSGIGEFSGTSHEFDAATGTYKFTANGNDFTITATSNDNPITQILIHHVQNQLGDMTLTRKADDGDATECEWADYIGTWYAAEGSDVYEIVISADGLNITHPGDSYTVSADDTTFNFDPEMGFTWTYQDVEYKLEISDDRLYFTDVAEEGDYYMYLSRVD